MRRKGTGMITGIASTAAPQASTAPGRWAAVLFDVDGVILDSGNAHRAAWHEWARRRGLDPHEVHATTQGRRRADILQLLAPDRPVVDEHQLLDELMATHEAGISTYPGAPDLLASLSNWGVVTSSRGIAVTTRFRSLGLPVPDVRICAEDVPEGKPSPAGYLAAAAALGADPARCLVIEDSPAGIEAGRGAGCTVYGVATTHTPEALSRAHVVFATLQDGASHIKAGATK